MYIVHCTKTNQHFHLKNILTCLLMTNNFQIKWQLKGVTDIFLMKCFICRIK